MRIKFWGVRGSLPTPIATNEIKKKIRNSLILAKGVDLTTDEKIDNFLNKLPINIYGTFGGNTPCVSIDDEDDNFIILDMGSGMRDLGYYILSDPKFKKNKTLNIFLSHTHWDHIQGFPFFVPAYNKDFTILFHSPFKNLKERLIQQQNYDFFPIELKNLPSKIGFQVLDITKTYSLSNHTEIKITKLNHPGDSYAYNIISKNKSVVYATDTEFYKIDEKFIVDVGKRWLNADILIFDAQYTPEEYIKKISWGHSSTMVAVDIGLKINTKKLILFHHDPTYNDDFIANTVEKAYSYLKAISPDSNMEIIAAYENLEINI